MATRLLQEGAASVVAMAYSVYAVAAAEFMAAFYERLFAGDTVTDAVTAGRGRLARNAAAAQPEGPDAAGRTGWCRCTTCAATSASPTSAGPGRAIRVGCRWTRSWTAIADTPQQMALGRRRGSVGGAWMSSWAGTGCSTAGGGVPAAAGGGAARPGRDREDRAGQGVRPVVARHRRRRPSATGSCWHSFEPGVASFGLDGRGRRRSGCRCSGPIRPARRRPAPPGRAAGCCGSIGCCWCWDNFESVHTMPDPTAATPPWTRPAAPSSASSWHGVAAGGAARCCITSRSPEPWLGARSGGSRWAG